MKIVYLEPKSRFPFLSSDSLYGAIIYALSELFPDKLNDILQMFKNKDEIPFKVSSTFPFLKIDDNNYIRFYPKIIINDPICKDISLLKKFKKIEFIEENIFLNLLNGNYDYGHVLDNIGIEFIINEYNEKFLLTYDSNELLNDGFFSKEINNHNVINRITNESVNIFYSENYRFNNNKGLFFLVDFNDSSSENLFIAALNFLRDRGFGKDISTGNGHFEFIIEDYDMFNEFNKNYSYFVTLSRFIPNELDLENISKFGNSYYDLGLKRSRDTHGLRKQTRFFKEGSVFTNFANIYGSVVDTSSKSVEIGYAFNIPYNLED